MKISTHHQDQEKQLKMRCHRGEIALIKRNILRNLKSHQKNLNPKNLMLKGKLQKSQLEVG